MRAFLEAVEDEPIDRIAAFFPKRGGWTWVQSYVDRAGRRGTWRFPATETLRAITVGGPACLSFGVPGAHVGPPEGVLSMQVAAHGTRWRRVGARRFVPPGAPDDSPAFVEWRLEDGEWVVSAFGDEYYYDPGLLGVSVLDRTVGRRDSTRGRRLTADDAYAEKEPWFISDEPIVFEGGRYTKYGLPRTLAEHEVTRIGSLGRVGVFAEAGASGAGMPDVLYLPVRPGGEFQPYQSFGGDSCR